jgi:selenocysteine-specific elongation factor
MMTAGAVSPSPVLHAQPRSVVIGTAGHIDHGKTALVRALTGIDTDRLPEEKRRGITIDLGFAALTAAAGDGSPLRVSFIDVPGHALFVRNMLAGAGGIDAVLLVISAEEGVKPQTEEHLAICDLLGISLGLTAITKIDAVDRGRLEEVTRSVARFLAGTFLSPAPIVPISARTGEGIDGLRSELSSLVERIPARAAETSTRLPLDRAFAMKGFGAVVTGTLISGALTVGQTVAIEPGGVTARVRGLQVHGHNEATVRAGLRVAVNLAGIEVSELERGQTLVEPSAIAAADTIDAEVRLLPHAPPLKHRSRVHLHAFTSECMATVSLYEYRPVEPGRNRLVRLRLSRPIVLLPGDRFVLRQGTPVATVGGGFVVDAHPLERMRKAACLAWLERLRASSREQELLLRVDRRGASGISAGALSAETGLTSPALRRLLAPLRQTGQLLWMPDDTLLTRDSFTSAIAQLAREFASRAKESGFAGLKRAELKSQTQLRPEGFELALKQLEKDRLLRVRNEMVFPFDFDQTGGDDARISAARAAFEVAGLAAPSPEELADRMAVDAAQVRRLITILLREKTLIRLGADSLCVHRRAIEELKEKLRPLQGQIIDVGRFKQLAGVSRKYAIPLLEYFDRERVTRKLGDQRIVL